METQKSITEIRNAEALAYVDFKNKAQAMNKITAKTLKECRDGNLQTMKLQLQFIINNNTKLPPHLTKQDMVVAMELGINNYVNSLKS